MSLSTVGLDSNSDINRFNGDNVHLSTGIQFTVVVIGLFSVSEILLMLEHQANASGWIHRQRHGLHCGKTPEREARPGCPWRR